MKCLALVLAATLPATALADGLVTTDDTRKACAAAADKFASNDIDGAFEGLSKYWPLPKEEIENLAYKTKTQLATVADRFGSAIASDHLDSDVIGSSLTRHIFLVKFEKHAIRFSCFFYKPHGEWKVNSVIWDDKIGDLFGH